MVLPPASNLVSPTGVKLCAEKKLAEPVVQDVVELVPNKGPIGKVFKKEAKMVTDSLAGLDAEEIGRIESALAKDGGTYELRAQDDKQQFTLTKEMLSGVKRYQKKVHVEEIIPSVIEPSFGIGRILYSLLEHNFRTRPDDEQRNYFSLPPVVAPVKCSVLPLSGNAEFVPLVKELSRALTEAEVSSNFAFRPFQSVSNDAMT